MQNLVPSNKGEDDKISANGASISCHASTAPSKHAESHGDISTALGTKKPSPLPLKQNTKLIQKPVISTRPLQKPEIPACIEACDVSSLLDKFLEYELNQSVTVNIPKDSSVSLTPVSSPSHKSRCSLTETLYTNKKPGVLSPIGLTPPVSPPSHQSIHSAAKSSPTAPTTPVTTQDKSKDTSSSPTYSRAVNENKNQDKDSTDGTMEKVTSYHKEPCSDVTINNVRNKSEMQHTTSTTQQNASSKTPEKCRNDTCHGNNKVVEKLTTNHGSGQLKSQETKKITFQFLQESKERLTRSGSVDRNDRDDEFLNLKRSYSSDDDKDYYDYKRKKYATRDECYWSTSEEESDDERRPYHSRKQGHREGYYRRRHRSRSSSSDSDDNHGTYRRSRSRTTNLKQQRRKETESKKENCIEEAPVYDIETERKKNFKLDRNFRETATEKRKIVYIGNIKESMTKNDVWRRFREYGPIEKVTVHYRNDGDNYSFVTFVDSSSALEAIEKGSKDPDIKHLDICFGGRRKFCGGSYVDFDSNTSYLEEKQINGDVSSSQTKNDEMDFDALLKLCQKKSR